MGGFGSGRHPSRVAIEDSLRLDLSGLIRRKRVFPGAYCAGSLIWTVSDTGRRIGFFDYEANLVHPAHAYVRLHQRENDLLPDYRVRIEQAPCRFGGSRWWWICPLTSLRANTLYLPPGATTFACRKAYCLAYPSERENRLDSTYSRQQRVSQKLGCKYIGFGEPLPDRPRGMHHRTYERLLAELHTAMDAYEAAFELEAARIVARKPATFARVWRA
jgi:hypothetical protein